MIKAKIDLICLFFRKQTVFQFHFHCLTTDEPQLLFSFPTQETNLFKF